MEFKDLELSRFLELSGKIGNVPKIPIFPDAVHETEIGRVGLDAERACQCDKTLRVRMIKGGRKDYKTYVYQCKKCGSSSEQISPSSLTYAQRFSKDLEPFDEGLRQRWREDQAAKREAAATERQLEQERVWLEKQEFYRDYINNSPEWRERSKLCIKLAPGGLCQGCGKRPPTQAHHLTYKHLGAEFLWELKAVCRDCHKRVHGITD